MGVCTYCGREAGWFRSRHRACAVAYEEGREKIRRVAAEAAATGAGLDGLDQRIRAIASEAYVSDTERKRMLARGWGDAVDRLLDDHVLSEEEAQRLLLSADKLALSRDELEAIGAWTKVVKATVIRELTEGKLPQRVSVSGQLPFNFMKSEHLVWLFLSTKYYEERTRRQYVGGYQGVSVRIARGLYYRVGGFRGHPVETRELTDLGEGALAFTTKHLYFAGPSKSFRIPFRKIVSFTPFSDGIGVQRDAASAKPQIFVTGDGWFTYNLASNLAQFE
jgi:hypothetical protein